MALKPCRECLHNVDSQAKNCPQCGAKRPAWTERERIFYPFVRVLGIILMVWFIFASVGSNDKQSENTSSQDTSTEIRDASSAMHIESPSTIIPARALPSSVHFSATVRLPKGTFTVRAYVNPDWERKLSRAGIDDDYSPVTIMLINHLPHFVRIHSISDRFFVVDSRGRQYESINSPSLSGEFSDADQEDLWGLYKDVLSGATMQFIVMFPPDLPPPEAWQFVMYNNTWAARTKLLDVNYRLSIDRIRLKRTPIAQGTPDPM